MLRMFRALPVCPAQRPALAAIGAKPAFARFPAAGAAFYASSANPPPTPAATTGGEAAKPKAPRAAAKPKPKPTSTEKREPTQWTIFLKAHLKDTIANLPQSLEGRERLGAAMKIVAKRYNEEFPKELRPKPVKKPAVKKQKADPKSD